MAGQYTYHDIPQFKDAFIAAKANAEEPNGLLNALLDNHNSRIKQMQEAFDRDNAKIIEDACLANNLIAVAEEELRELLVDFYNATKTKTYDKNLGVQVRTKTIYDMAKAVAWAETNAPVMIQKTIDKKAFESLPSIGELEFVTIEESVVSAIRGL